MGKLQLGYWSLRGRGEPIRMMMEYGGLEYENVYYHMGVAPEYDNSSWTDVKYKLGLDFPNLPYLIDGDLKFTETWAICRYLAKKLDLGPRTEKEEIEGNMLQGNIDDFWFTLSIAAYNPNFENLKEGLREKQTERLANFDKFLTGKKFLLGDRITFVDFPFYEKTDHHRMLFPDILDNFPNVQAFMKRFAAQENIAAYFKSGRYHRMPVHGTKAQWGGGKEL